MPNKNAYFEKMHNHLQRYAARQQGIMQKKQEIIEKHGPDSQELHAWYQKYGSTRHPFTQGEMKAYHAWADSAQQGLDVLDMADFLWEYEVRDFVRTLREAGIGAFTYTNHSAAAMDNIHQLADSGCVLKGVCSISARCGVWFQTR